MEKVEMTKMDPETEFLASKQETGHEWELYKENVRPLKRGRNVRLLNDALKSHTDIQLKKSLLHNRRRLIEAIDEYKGDDPLQPWLECIKWVQEAFPPGGDCSGLVVIYEQCVRTFWHEARYRDDLRYLKVWLEYAGNCIDAEVIYSFLDANGIGQTHSIFFISYALHMESKNKIRTANDIFNSGISRNAQPIEKLKAAYKKFLVRSMSRPKATDEDEADNRLPVRSFGTLLARGEARNQNMESSDRTRKKLKQDRVNGTPITIYKDTSMGSQSDSSKSDFKSWHTLGARAERNKENNAVPAKWTSNKIPQRSGHRTGGATTASACIEVFVDEECTESGHRTGGVSTASACIEVFVDEECTETHKAGDESGRSSTLRLRGEDCQDLKKETELLRENPLRNFPLSSMPR